MDNAYPRVEALLVPAGRDREVICLLDTSGSMEWEAAAGSPVTRHQLVAEALLPLVSALEGEDSAAAGEQASGSDEKGGLYIHGFADAHTDLGDFNTSNFARRWADIRWGGSTAIMPAWRAAASDYDDEFGSDPYPPALLCVVITDGEARDAAEFTRVLTESGPDQYFAVAVLGHGLEHDSTLASYQEAAVANPSHVKVMSFASVTNPAELASDLIRMAGTAQ
jgi:hypothetical protein